MSAGPASAGSGPAGAPAQHRRGGRPPHPAVARRPQFIAHRGGAGLYPENTLYAFRRAVEDWAVDAIELDVHATADGHCVVIHDPTVDRTTEGTGRVADLTLAELRRLDAGHRFTRDGGQTFPRSARACTPRTRSTRSGARWRTGRWTRSSWTCTRRRMGTASSSTTRRWIARRRGRGAWRTSRSPSCGGWTRATASRGTAGRPSRDRRGPVPREHALRVPARGGGLGGGRDRAGRARDGGWALRRHPRPDGGSHDGGDGARGGPHARRAAAAGRGPPLHAGRRADLPEIGAGLYPENTLYAFRRAVEDWAVDAIELDVHATADGHCVVIHDPTVDRTTEGTGRVADLTLAELRRLDAGHRFTRDGGQTFPRSARACTPRTRSTRSGARWRTGRWTRSSWTCTRRRMGTASSSTTRRWIARRRGRGAWRTSRSPSCGGWTRATASRGTAGRPS